MASAVEATKAEPLEELPQMVQDVFSSDPQRQHQATKKVRKLLSKERNPPIEEVLRRGVVPKFVEFLQRDDNPQLQLEAAWALTMVGSGTSDHVQVVINHGAVPAFVSLLNSSSKEVREQAVYALGKFSANSPKCRDMILCHNVLQPLLQQMGEGSKISMLRNAAWTLSNLCKGIPPPSFTIVKTALPTLARIIHQSDEEVVADACWALSYMSEGGTDRIAKIIEEAGVCRRLVALMLHPSPAVVVPALRTIRNLTSGNDAQTQAVVNCNVLSCILTLLGSTSSKASVKEVACVVISHVTARTSDQIQAVIDAGLIPWTVHLMASGEACVKAAAARAIRNAVLHGTAQQVRYLVSQGCIKPLCGLLLVPSTTHTDASEALQGILRVGEQLAKLPESSGQNPYAQAIVDATGTTEVLEQLEVLQAGAGPSGAQHCQHADRSAAKRRRLAELPSPAAAAAAAAAAGPSQQQSGSSTLPLVMDLSPTTSSSGPFVVVRVRGDNPLVARYTAAVDALAGGQQHPLAAVDIDLAVRAGDGECVAARVPLAAVQQLYVAAGTTS